jgi:hypothetical protein
MTHTNQQLAQWIESEWSEDQFRYQDIQADFRVLNFIRDGNSLTVSCSFISDEAKMGSDAESLVLFRYDPENYDTFFPRTVQMITADIKYVWGSKSECDDLSSQYEEESLDLDVDQLEWEDPRLSDLAVETLLRNSDHRAIAETLVELYGAKDSMPSFVPERLRPYFKKYIEDLTSS